MLRKMILHMFMILLIQSCVSTQMPVRGDYVKTHPTINPMTREAILRGDVSPGMTQEEVKASWGEPSEIVQGDDGRTYYDYISYTGPIGGIMKS